MHEFYKRILLVVALFAIVFKANSQTSADYETMYTRLYNSMYSAVSSYDLSNQNSDGTFKNVTYTTVQPTDNTGGARPHLYEMVAIAKAYLTSGAQYKSPELLDAYCKAWNWWNNNNPQDTNWWYRSIGWPNSLYPSFVLMASELKESRPDEYNSLVAYLMYEWTPAKVDGYKADPDAANTSEICKYTLATAIVTQNATAITEASEILASLIRIENVDRSNGIQPDYSFSQHTQFGRQLYMGTYGKEYVGGIINFLSLTTNTFFEIPAEKMTIFENLYLEGASWMIYRKMFDHHQHGRMEPSSTYVQKYLATLNGLLALNTPQKEKLQKLYDWMARPTGSDENNVQQGNRMFWRHDYMVHKGANYFASSRMTSTRTTCSESGNGEGIKNYYTGSGVNYIYLTGTEYEEIWDVMNWRRLPGITSTQKPFTTTLPLVEWGKNGSNLNAFAGGVSDGKTGASGFLFDKKTNEVNLSANKSWFYFKDYIVALGADIKAGQNFGVPVATTVNQVKYKGAFTVDNNGAPASIENSQSLSPTTSNWAYINNIGYQFITNTNLNFEVKTINSIPLAWLNFQHGNVPTNAQYAYAVYPNVTQEQLADRISNTPFEVVSNTSTVQSVADMNEKIVQAIFYKAARLPLPGGLGFVETNQPAAIQLRWQNDSVYVSAANPYCESSPLSSITVKLAGQYAGESATASTADNATTVQLALSSNEFEGKSVTVGLLKSSVTGLDFIKDKASPVGIYPNPVKAGATCFILNPSFDSRNVRVAIYTLTGAMVKEFDATADAQNRIGIATNGLQKGMYVVKCGAGIGRMIID